jgi:hypothetical protein
MVLHQPDGVTWAILVSGNPVRETDNLRQVMERALTTVNVWPS